MISFRFQIVLLLLAIVGASVFVWQLLGSESARAWQSFFINLLFFSAIAQSGSVLAAIYHLTEARWGSRVMSLAIGLGSFLPISFVLFIVLFAGFPYLPNYSPEFPARHSWFKPWFLIGREILALAILYAVSLVFSYRFLISTIARFANDSREIRGSTDTEGEVPYQSIANGRSPTITPLAILVLAAYAVVFSLLGFDLVMGLDKQWYSTLFGGYFFISSFYIGLAAIIVAVFLVGRHWKGEAQAHGDVRSDLGKLALAFCLLTTYLFWSQYLVTWYGNLPEEVGFFIRRFRDPSWQWLTWVTVVLTFAIPFLTLLSQHTKRNGALFFVAITALAGMWLERYMLIVPSLGLTAAPALGWVEVAITSSFLAGIIFTYTVYLNFYDGLKSQSDLRALQAAKAH